MFFDDLGQVSELAERAGTAVFAVGPEVAINTKRGKKKTVKTAKSISLPGAIIVEPGEGKNYISVEQVREVIEMTRVRETGDRYFVFREAEKLREEAENSMLKLLEEPKENYHFILLTEQPEALLTTILSRAEVYYLRRKDGLGESPKADKKVMEMAKRLLVTKSGSEYLKIADEIHKKKEAREYALEVLETTIELAYKSFFMTGKQQFLRKIPEYLRAYENIRNNGNVRLHLVADLC